MTAFIRILYIVCLCTGCLLEAQASEGRGDAGIFDYRAEEPVVPVAAVAKVNVGGVTVRKSVCAGETVTFSLEVTGTEHYSAAWRKVSRTDSLQKDGLPFTLTTVTVADAGEYYCEIIDSTDADLRFYSDTLTLRVNAYSVSIQALPVLICRGDTVVIKTSHSALEEGEKLTYRWTATGVPVVGADNLDSLVVNGVADGTVRLESSGGGCTAESREVRINVHKFRVGIQAPDAGRNVCRGDSLALTASGDAALSYQWEGDGIAGDDLTGNAVDVKFADNGMFVLNSSDGQCTDTDTIRYRVQTFSLKINTPSGVRDICKKAALRLTSSYTGDEDLGEPVYLWEGAGILAAKNAINVDIIIGENGKFKLNATLGACAAADSVVYGVHEYKVNILDPAQLRVCNGDTVTLRASNKMPRVEGDTLYSWKGERIIGPDNLDSVKVLLDVDGLVKLSSRDRYCSDSAKVVFDVRQFRVKIQAPAPDRAVCYGDSLVFYAIGTTPASYSWEGAGVNEEHRTAGTAEMKFTDNGQFVLNSTNGECRSTDTVRYTIQKLETAIVAPSAEREVCSGESLSFSSSVSTSEGGKVVYRWEGEGISGVTDQPEADVVVARNGKFKLYTSFLKCKDVDSVVYNVHYYEAAIVPPPSRKMCYGDTVVLRSTHAAVTGDTVYKWTAANIVGPDNLDSVKVVLTTDGKVSFHSSAYGCTADDSYTFTIVKYNTKITTLTEDREVCYGVPVSLSVSNASTAPAGSSWQWSGEGVVGNNTGATIQVKPEANGTFMLRYTDGVCVERDTIRFSVRRYDVKIQKLSDVPERCWLDTLTLWASNRDALPVGATMEWKGAGIKGSTAGNSVKVLLDENPQFSLKASDGKCFSYDTVRFSIHKYNVGIRKPDSWPDICRNSELALSATDLSGASYHWAGEGLTGAADTTEANFRVGATAVYSLAATDGTCYTYDTLRFVVREYKVGIKVPSSGKTVCHGDLLRLEATNNGSVPAGATYAWTGAGITGAANQPEVQVKLTSNGSFRLRSTLGACTVEEQIDFTIRKYEVSIPAGLTLPEPQKITINAIKNPASVLDWSLNNDWVIRNSTSDHVDFNITGDSRVIVKMTVNADKCTAYDTCDVRISVKDARKYQGGDADGFAEARPAIRLMDKAVEVCVNTPAAMGFDGYIHSCYVYEWYKVGAEADPPVCKTKDLWIPRCALEDAGDYYCRVKDADGSGYIYSDTLALTVKDGPVARIQTDGGKTVFCYGEDISLSADSRAPGYEYLWTGEGIVGGITSSEPVIKAVNGGLYTLTVSDGICSSLDSIRIRVKAPLFLDIPGGINLAAAQTIKVAARRANPRTEVTWEFAGARQTSRDSVPVHVTVPGILRAEITEDGCVVRDSCPVRIKESHTFTGGSDDGFGESTPRLFVVNRLLEYCTGEAAEMGIQGISYYNCEYKWYRTDAADAVGTGRTFTIPFCKELDGGSYYCQASSGGQLWNSDTLLLVVTPGPVAQIDGKDAGKQACYGSRFQLQVDPPGNSYQWRGEGIIGGRNTPEVTIVAKNSSFYSVVVSDGKCATKDSVWVEVIRSYVEIPYDLKLAEKQEIKVGAKRHSAEQPVTWYVNGFSYTTSKDSVFLRIDGSGTVVAEVTEGGALGCKARDTMLVYVKDPGTFRASGAGNDGFAESRNHLKVVEPVLTPCPTEDIVMKLRSDNGGYTNYCWFKVGNPIEVGKGMSYEILNCNDSYDGQYYCRVQDANRSGYLYSDTITLTVRPGVVAEIMEPKEGTDLCFGNRIVLEAQPRGAGYTYQWTGPGIIAGAETSALTAEPKMSGQYRLAVSNGSCTSVDTMSVSVRRIDVDILQTLLLEKAGNIVFQAYRSEDLPVMWYVNKSLKETSKRPVSLNISESGRVVAVMESGHCTDSAVCEVFVKNKDIFQAGDNDGFAESKMTLQLVKASESICRGHEVTMEVRDWGYGSYVYNWYKYIDGADGDKFVATGRAYTIPVCSDADDGRYYCKVFDADVEDGGSQYIVSPYFTLEVVKGPQAEIVADKGPLVCYEEEIELDAWTRTEESNQGGETFDYTWMGPGIFGKTGGKIKVKPTADAVYAVFVSDASTKCTDSASYSVQVKHLAVEIADHLSVAKAGDYPFKVYNPSGAALTWQIDRSPVTVNNNVLPLTANCEVIVRGDLDGCTEYDSCTVYVKDADLYTAVPGDDDGFAASVTIPRAFVSPADTAVCSANSLRIALRVAGDGLYKYSWYKIGGGSDVIATTRDLEFEDVNSTVIGAYYCIVENLLEPEAVKRFVFSDTAHVTFREGPVAKIGSPADGTDICDGVEITLDASASEDGRPDADYKYEWLGAGAEGLTDKVVTFKPRSGMYVVRVSDPEGGCSSTDTVFLNMNRPEIHLPLQIHLAAPQFVELKPLKQEGTLLNWYIGDNKVLSGSDIGRLDLKNDCRVIVEMVLPVEGGTCSGYDTSYVYIKSQATFTASSGGDDGFAASLPKTDIRQEEGETQFCRGTEIFRTVNNTVAEKLLSYQWRKVGFIDVISKEKDLRIPVCQLSDAGDYYCMAIDLAETDPKRKVLYSDTVKITVKPGPIAKISSPADGQEVCYETQVLLDATETETTKVPNTDVYEYLWTGDGVRAANLYRTEAYPTNSGVYILKVTNGECTTYDTARVKVNAPDVYLPRTVYMEKRGIREFVVANPNENVVNWYMDNKLKVEKKDTAALNVIDNCSVIVEILEEGCRKTDTCQVFLKDPRSFITGVGEKADDDGFFASGSGFYIKRVVSTEWVCEGATSVFTAEVVGNDFYRYAWKKKGNPTVLSTTSTYRIEKTGTFHEGVYYCEVTEVSSNKTLISEEAPLQVIAMPKTHILAESNRVCEGSSMDLKADLALLPADREYVYLWVGPGITDNRNNQITITPSNSSRYTLTISDANCFTKDTLNVEVVKETLKVPKVKYVKEGDNISLQAEVPAGTTVNWRVDGVYYQDVNPLVLNGLKKSVDYTVETAGVCTVQESGHIFVRTNAGYAGGEDDGFTMPNGLPQIIDWNDPDVVGCGVDTATLWVEVLKKESANLKYVWQRYSESERDFITFVPGLPEGHVTGLNTDRLRFSTITPEDEGRYRCMVFNGLGVSDSHEVNLVRGKIPEIAQMPDMQRCEGSKAQFIAVASVPGGKDPKYRWYTSKTTTNFSQLLPEDLLNKTYYEIEKPVKTHQGYYMVEAYNLCGSVYDTAYLEIWQKPTVVKQNGDTAVCNEGTIRLWTEAIGGGTYVYSLIQVEVDRSGKYLRDKRVVYNNGLNPWYDLGPASEVDNGYFVWKVWNECDSTRSTRPFRLDVEQVPVVNFSFQDTTVCIGNPVLTLDARPNIFSPGASTRYYWTKDGQSITQTAALHSISSMVHRDTGVYKCYAYNACPAQIMKEFRVHKKEAPLITGTISLEKDAFCEGEPVEIPVDYTSDAGNVQFVWYFGRSPLSDVAGRITGTRGDTLQIDSVIGSDAGAYHVRLKNDCPNWTLSNEVRVTVDLPARFEASGGLENKDQYLCIGDNSSLVVVASGKAPIEYTWTKDNEKILGAKDKKLALNNVSRVTAGHYCCYVQNSCSKVDAEVTCANVNVITPKVYDLSGGGKYCGYEDGRDVRLSGHDSAVVYQLYRYTPGGTSVMVKSVNGESVKKGDTLSFGFMEYGTYFAKAVARVSGKECSIVMNNEVEIIRDVTPSQYEFKVSDPICTGEKSGNLRLSGSDNDAKIDYVLQRYISGDEWVDNGKRIPGNGGALSWGNMAAGIYRVMATSTVSGCAVQIGKADTLTERPYPQVFKLLAVNGDTTNCQYMEADVALQLDGFEPGCTYTLQKDGEATGAALNAAPILWDKLAGSRGGVSYSVLSTTRYGCSSVMDSRTVVEKNAPEAYLVSGGGHYCSGETGSREIMIEGKTQVGVRYDIYEKPDRKLTDTVLFGNKAPLVFELPNVAGEYYVMAVDTLDGCIRRMDNDVIIQEDSLKIMPIPTQMIPIGTSTRLSADVRNAVGNYTIAWEPADLIAGSNTVASPTTAQLNRGQRYIVTVEDGSCKAEAFAEVRFLEGELLFTEIKLFDCLTDKDTLVLCEGEPLELCSWTSGGNGEYSYKWIDADVPGAVIPADSRLEGYRKPASGYMYLEVTTTVGQNARDSIWIAFKDKPDTELAVVKQGLNCAQPGEQVVFNLKKAEKGVKYTLEYSKDARRYVSTDTVKMGEGADLPFSVVFADTTAGYYRFRAEKDYGDGNVCTAELNAVELRQGPQMVTLNSFGLTEYCADMHRDSIYLDTTEIGVTYRLLNTAKNGALVKAAEGTGDTLLFSGYFGTGRYRVIGQRDMCRDTMDGVVNINAMPRPLIGEIEWSGVHCLGKGDNPEVKIYTPIRGVEYTLYRDSVDVRETVIKKYGSNGALSLGKLEKPGNYFIVSSGLNGTGCTDTVKGLSVVNKPGAIQLMESAGMYCYGENGLEVNLKIRKVDPLVDYLLLDSRNTEVGRFSGLNKDTLYYKGTLTNGKYYIWPNVPDCSEQLAMYEVTEHKQMTDKALLSPLTECEGNMLLMGVKGSEVSTVYELYKEIGNGVQQYLTEFTGNGNDMEFGRYREAAGYVVIARDPVSGCRRQLTDEYLIKPMPEYYDITVSATEYCQGDAGVEFGISGTQVDVRYLLQKWDEATSQYADVSASAVIFGTGATTPEGTPVGQVFSGKFKKGKYRVVTDNCGKVPMNGEISVSEKLLPLDIVAEIAGKACIDSTFSLVLKSTEPGVRYVIHHNDKAMKLDTLTGNGRDTLWTISGAKTGEYSVKAIRNGCVLTLSRKFEMGIPTLLSELMGLEQLCANETKSLTIQNASAGALYELWGERADTIIKGVKAGLDIQFPDVPAGDIYYVKAKNNKCETVSKPYNFRSKELPVYTDENFVINDCGGADGGDILLHDLELNYQYRLVGTGVDAQIINRTTDTLFRGLRPGIYSLTITNAPTQCSLKPVEKTIRRPLPADSVVQPLAYCAGGTGINIKLSGATYNVRYSMLDLDEKVMETFDFPVKIFTRGYPAGQYVFKKENVAQYGGCFSKDTIEVKMLEIPDVSLTVISGEGGVMCETGNNKITINNSQPGVSYILRRGGLYYEDTLRGNGGSLVFAKKKKAGYYEIIAKNDGLCEAVFPGRIQISPVPSKITAEDGQYCYEPANPESVKGTQIFVSNLDPTAEYYFINGTQKVDSITAVNAGMFKVSPAGEYIITGIYSKTGCRDTVAKVSIRELRLPQLFAVTNTNGSNCDVRARIRLNGSEGDSVEYSLYMNQFFLVSGPVRGTGGALDFSEVTAAGTYQVYANKVGAECGTWMNDKVVIASKAPAADFVVAGISCEGEHTAGAKLVMKNAQKGWSYFVTSGAKVSKTILAEVNGVIRWDSVGGKIVTEGVYDLQGMNECGEVLQLASVSVKTQPKPEMFRLICRDTSVCPGTKQQLVLKGSQVGVSYGLRLVNGDYVTDLLPEPLPGGGGRLNLGDFDASGRYEVTATVDSTGCSSVMDTIRMWGTWAPTDPLTSTKDKCIEPGTPGGIEIELGHSRVPKVDYYLEVNGVYVDTITRYEDILLFKPQAALGCYFIVGVNIDNCVGRFTAPCQGESPDLSIPIAGTADTTICAGDFVVIKLDSSQLGVRYSLLRGDVDISKDSIRGTGGPLVLDTVRVSGDYTVRGWVTDRCNAVLTDHKNVTVLSKPDLQVEQDLGYCAGGAGVELWVRNTVNSPLGKPGVDYRLSDKDGWITTQAGTGGDMRFTPLPIGPNLFKAGTYTVKATDRSVTTCPAEKQIVVREIASPTKYELKLQGNRYMCEYPQSRSMVLASSQKDVVYSLFRRREPGVLAAPAQDGTGKPLTFSVSDTGRYYVMACSAVGDRCETEMANEVEIVVPKAIEVFNLTAARGSYCQNVTQAAEKGAVNLSGSEMNVSYQLFKDGVMLGQVKPGNLGKLGWTGLEGKACDRAAGDSDGFIYTVTATNQTTGCVKRMTGDISIIEEKMPVIIVQAQDAEVCTGTKYPLALVTSGCMLNYVWKKDGKVVGNNVSYVMDSITSADIGFYTCEVSNKCGMAQTSRPIEVKVKAIVIMNKKMDDVLVCEEPADVRINSTAIAEEYKWMKAGDTRVLSDKRVLELNGVRADAAGTYVCLASTSCGGVYDTCLLEFNRNPEVKWKGAVNKTLCVGSEHSLVVESRDSVKWYLNGKETKVIGNVYRIDKLTLADSGMYSVVAINSCSNSGDIPLQLLNVDRPIQVISVTDSLKHYCKNSEFTLEIITDPHERVTYKWYRNNVYYQTGSNRIRLRATDPENGVNYLVRYSNACTDPDAEPAQRGMTIKVDDNVVFNKLGANTEWCTEAGGTGELKVKRQNVEGEVYSWYYRKVKDAAFQPMAEKNSKLLLSKQRSSDGYYYCKIENACGVVFTDTTMVRVDSVPVISGNLRDTTVCENGNLNLLLKAKGNGMTYRWMVRQKNGREECRQIFSPEGFETVSELKLTNLSVADDSCQVWCEITNTCATKYSDTAVIRIPYNATVRFEQSAAKLCEGNEIRMVVHLEHGTLPAVYEYTLNDGAKVLRDFRAPGIDTLNLSAAGTYKVVSLEGNGCVNKTPDAELQLSYHERFSAVLSGGSDACIGEDAVLNVTVNKGTGPWSVLLLRESDNQPAVEIGESPVQILEKNATVRFKPAKNEKYYIGRIYEIGVAGGCDGMTSGKAEVKVHMPLHPAFKMLDRDVFGGCETVDFDQVLSPNVGSGRYYVNNKPVESTLMDKEPGKYCIVYVTTTAHGCVDSAVVSLIRDSLPKVTLSAQQSLCPGESTDLRIHVSGAGPFTVLSDMKEIDLENKETFYNNLRKLTDKEGDCYYNVFNNNKLKSRTYEVKSVTDKYKCEIDPKAKMIIYMRERPVMEVSTQHALYNGGAWTSDVREFVIPNKGAVSFRVTKKRGQNPWDVNVVKTTNGVSESINFPNINTGFVEIYPAPEGEYRFSISDNYCSLPEELEEVRTVKYTETGFLRVKVMLQGAYSAESGKMRSGIEALLPLKGMASLPDAGEGKQLIDWVTFELRKDVNGEAIVRDSFLLRSDGFVVDRSGNDMLSIIGENFSNLLANTYHVVIKHRNHLTIASKECMIFTEPSLASLVDLTNPMYIYSKDGNLANHMVELTVQNGLYVWGMAVGNILNNGMISIANPNEIQQVDRPQTEIKGYYRYDVNFDGFVKWQQQGILNVDKLEGDESDDAYLVYKNRNIFSEIP